MKNKKWICEFYFIVWMFYNLQSALNYTGSIFSQLLAAIVVGMSLYFFIYAFRKMVLPKPLKILSYMLFIWTIYGVIMIIQGKTNGISSFDYIKVIYVSLLPIFTIYVFASKGWLTEDVLIRWTYVFVVVALISYYYFVGMSNISQLMGTDKTNNLSTEILGLLPLIPLFWRKPTIQYLLLSICVFHMLYGMKRGVIIIGGLCALWIIIRSFKLEDATNNKKVTRQIMRIVLASIVVFGAFYLVSGLLSSGGYFVDRLEQTKEGNSSGRDMIYSTMLNHFLNESNLVEILFGNGGYATLFMFDSYAHDDWLEISINNGLVMIILYAMYWVSFVKLYFKSKKNTVERNIIGAFLMIYFFRTLVSMSYNDIPIYSSVAIGYALANYKYKVKTV